MALLAPHRPPKPSNGPTRPPMTPLPPSPVPDADYVVLGRGASAPPSPGLALPPLMAPLPAHGSTRRDRPPCLDGPQLCSHQGAAQAAVPLAGQGVLPAAPRLRQRRIVEYHSPNYAME